MAVEYCGAGCDLEKRAVLVGNAIFPIDHWEWRAERDFPVEAGCGFRHGADTESRMQTPRTAGLGSTTLIFGGADHKSTGTFRSTRNLSFALVSILCRGLLFKWFFIFCRVERDFSAAFGDLSHQVLVERFTGDHGQPVRADFQRGSHPQV